MVRGDEVLANVRLIEGWTFRQFRAELAKRPTEAGHGSHERGEIMAAIGAPGVAAEGRSSPTPMPTARASATWPC
jgi:UPF0755 protein